MKNGIAILIGAVLLAGCAPAATQAVTISTQAPLATYTPYPTYTPQATYTAAPTIAVTVDHAVVVTQLVVITTTPLPETATLAASATPAQTDTEVPTENAQTATAVALAPLVGPHADGNYLVNVDIAPGVWRNDGTASDGTDCYWQTQDKTGKTLKNYIGAGKGTMFIAASDFEVRMERCGNWTYIGQ